MQREGREMMRANEYLYGWKTTAQETVAPEVWKKMFDVYVKDEYHRHPGATNIWTHGFLLRQAERPGPVQFGSQQQ
jgi:cobalamin biosynthesis Mg chelatase CobN